jgi:hypothetical protein
MSRTRWRWAKKRFWAACALDALGDLSEIHASGEVCKALSREDDGANCIISEYLGQLLLQTIDVTHRHEVEGCIVNAEGRNVIGH